MSKLAVIVGTSEATRDPLELLIEKEERVKRDKKDEESDNKGEVKVSAPCLVLIPNSFKEACEDPCEILIALSDPEEVLRQALIN